MITKRLLSVELSANSVKISLMLGQKAIKQDFPLFSQPQHQDLIYLDSAATTQKPKSVIDAIHDYYLFSNANAGRSVHSLAQKSNQLLKESRCIIASFFGAKEQELILTRNTTEAINGAAWGWAQDQIMSQDVVLTSLLEHHSNLVPWQQVCKRKKAVLKFVDLSSNGQIDLDDLEQKLKEHSPKLLALTHLSNVLGCCLDLPQVVSLVKEHSPQTRILIDAAQSAGKMALNFDQLGIDFLAFSGHKMYGPMGIGGLLVKEELMQKNEMKPWLYGGGMIEKVQLQNAAFHPDSNQRFTAGTADAASALGLAAACNYLLEIGLEEVLNHELKLVEQTFEKLQQLEEVEIYGPPFDAEARSFSKKRRLGPVSFAHSRYLAHDIAQVLDHHQIAVRSGHHCCMPLHHHFNWQATVRLSFGLYTSLQDIEKLAEVVGQLDRYLS